MEGTKMSRQLWVRCLTSIGMLGTKYEQVLMTVAHYSWSGLALVSTSYSPHVVTLNR